MPCFDCIWWLKPLWDASDASNLHCCYLTGRHLICPLLDCSGLSQSLHSASGGFSPSVRNASFGPLATFRKEQRVAEVAAKAAAAAARAKETAVAATAVMQEAAPEGSAAPAQAGSPEGKPEQDPVRLKPKANQRQRPTAQPPAKQPGVLL